MSPKTNRILWPTSRSNTQIPSATSRVFSTIRVMCKRWTLVVAFHVSSVHKTIQPWWMACRFTLTQRVLPQGVKFPYPLSTWHLIHSTKLPGTDTNSIRWSAEKCSCSRSHSWSKDSQRRTRLPKHKVDDKASSKTHLVRFMHSVVTSKFKIFSVAKTRCRNNRFSPKTPEVFPVLNLSSKIQFFG